MGSLAVIVDSITSAVVAPGGGAMTLVTRTTEGTEVPLTFPYDQIMNLVEAAVAGRTECKKQQGKEPNNDADLLITKRFEFGRDIASGLPVLILTMGSGGKLSWVFQGGMEAQLYETIGVFLGLSNPSIPADVRAN